MPKRAPRKSRDVPKQLELKFDGTDQCSVMSEEYRSDSQWGTIPPHDHPPNVAERRNDCFPEYRLHSLNHCERLRD